MEECGSCLLVKETVVTPCKDTHMCRECWDATFNWPPEVAVLKCPLCMVPMKDWHIPHGKRNLTKNQEVEQQK